MSIYVLLSVVSIAQSKTVAVANLGNNVSISLEEIDDKNNLIASLQQEDIRQGQMLISDLPCGYDVTIDNVSVFDSFECDFCVPDGNLSYWRKPNGNEISSFLTKNFSISTDSKSVVGRGLYYGDSCGNIMPYKNRKPVQVFYLTPVATQFPNSSWISVNIQQFGYEGPFLVSSSIANGSATIYLTTVSSDGLSCVQSDDVILEVNESRAAAELITYESLGTGIPDLRNASVRLFLSYKGSQSTPPYCTPLEGAHDECSTSPCGTAVHCTDNSKHTIGDYICTCQSPETGDPTVGRPPICSTSDESSKMMFLFIVAIVFAIAILALGVFLYCANKRIKKQDNRNKDVDLNLRDITTKQATQGKDLSLITNRDRAMRDQHDKSELQKANFNAALTDCRSGIKNMLSGDDERRKLQSTLHNITGTVKGAEMTSVKSNKQLDDLHDNLLL